MGVSVAQQELGWNVPSRGESIDMRYTRFLVEHPTVMQALAWLARQKVAADRRRGLTPRVGAKGLLENLRWGVFPSDAPDYVVNAPNCDNTFASRFARSLAASFDDLADVFEFRELNS